MPKTPCGQCPVWRAFLALRMLYDAHQQSQNHLSPTSSQIAAVAHQASPFGLGAATVPGIGIVYRRLGAPLT